MGSIYGRALKAGGLFLFLSVVLFSLTLNQAHAYPAPQFQNAKVFSFHATDGSISTIFFAIISGPSPVDVASFTATGPSGPFNLASGQSFQQYGLYYVYGHSGIVNNGSYTLTVTDSIGRTASVVREFTYDENLPVVAGMTPANETYVGTTTPTLSFSPVTGNYCYQVQIRDYDSKAIWYNSPHMTIPSFTVPNDMLRPNMAYRWKARVWDIVGQNCRESVALFYTGTKGAPEINLRGILSFPWDSNFLNFLYARGIHAAPWDIDYFRATGPDNTVYDLTNGRYYQFTFSAYNANITTFDPPASIPDGTYTFEIKDDLGRTDSDTRTYAYNPIPDFIEDSRVPADNAYLDTDKPTFSWAKVTGDTGDGAYRYTIRITDYTTGMRWFDSPYSTETSFTPTEPLNLPKGSSYKWRVNVIDANGNNYRNSSSPRYRTLTFNAAAAPPVLYVNNNDDTCDGNEPCYTSIQGAINAAATTASIRLAEGTYNEIFQIFLSKAITFQGGWDTTFATQTPNKTFIKSPTVTQGSLTMQMLTIKPL